VYGFVVDEDVVVNLGRLFLDPTCRPTCSPIVIISTISSSSSAPCNIDTTANWDTRLTFLLVVVHRVSLCRQASHTSSGIRPSF
jgi:hypothetical protein